MTSGLLYLQASLQFRTRCSHIVGNTQNEFFPLHVCINNRKGRKILPSCNTCCYVQRGNTGVHQQLFRNTEHSHSIGCSRGILALQETQKIISTKTLTTPKNCLHRQSNPFMSQRDNQGVISDYHTHLALTFSSTYSIV